MVLDEEVDERKLLMARYKYSLTVNDEKKLKYKSEIEYLFQRIDILHKRHLFHERFRGKTLVIRDTILCYGTIYLLTMIFTEITIYQKTIMMLMTLDTFLEVLTNWCTTYVVILFISCGLQLVTMVTVALSRWFITNIDILEAFNSDVDILEAIDMNFNPLEVFNIDVDNLEVLNILERPKTNIDMGVAFAAVIAFTEANILAIDNIEKIEDMKLAGFLSINAIMIQIINVVERKILIILSRGTSFGVFFYVRAFVLSGLLVTIPSLFTLSLARSLGICPWLLFFASGNFLLIFHVLSFVLEFTLIKVMWYSTNYLKIIEHVLFYTKVCVTVIAVIVTGIQNYCRYICPFLNGPWLLRLCIVLFYFITTTTFYVSRLFYKYKLKYFIPTVLTNLKDVSFRLKKEEIDQDRTNDCACAICSLEITKGKQLPCNHAFHYDCLRKWFYARSGCPLCNTKVKLSMTEQK